MVRNMNNLSNLDDHRISKALERQIISFIDEPPDSDFLKGYLSGLVDFFLDELGCEIEGTKLRLLTSMCMMDKNGSDEMSDDTFTGYGTTKTCANCLWASGNGDYRECCLEPPKILVGSSEAYDSENPAHLGVFPKVFDEWWCGKWQSRGEVRPTLSVVKD